MYTYIFFYGNTIYAADLVALVLLCSAQAIENCTMIL
jgi:hypothetical protein